LGIVCRIRWEDTYEVINCPPRTATSKEAVTIADYIPAALTIAASVIAATWCMTHGSTINASTTVEKGRTSVWGVSLNLMGALLIFYGFLAGLMLTMEQVSPLVILFMGLMALFGLILMVSIAKSGGDEKSIKSALDGLGSWGAITALVVFMSILFILIGGGGEGDMIPDAAWGLLMGALTMIGSGFAAALCIMTAVKAGAEMLVEKPELSIWSLLFVALGEGLAIYGLIVAILLIG
jgi:V/A-type H+-transporting ATPase subunit K